MHLFVKNSWTRPSLNTPTGLHVGGEAFAPLGTLLPSRILALYSTVNRELFMLEIFRVIKFCVKKFRRRRLLTVYIITVHLIKFFCVFNFRSED